MQIRTLLTLITGPLGSGKTTLLRHILTIVPQKIAILMNEFGKITSNTGIIGSVQKGGYSVGQSTVYHYR